MKLSKREEKICQIYSTKSDDGHGCWDECPLAIKTIRECKKTMAKEKWEDYILDYVIAKSVMEQVKEDVADLRRLFEAYERMGKGEEQ